MPPADATVTKLYSAVRRASGVSAAWPQGAQLAQSGAVSLDRESEDELVFSVEAPGFPTPPTAALYPDGPEWTCDCGGSLDPCPHVAAAVIALDAARKRGEPLGPRARALAAVGYRFARAAHGAPLSLARVLVRGAQIEPLAGRLAEASNVAVTDADQAADRLLDGYRFETLPPERRAELLAALARATDVQLDGAPVRVSDEPVVPRAVVEDHRDGFVLRIERDPAVTEVLAPGLALAGDALRPVGEAELGGASLERLPRTQTIPRARAAELVCDTLPDLARRIPVDLRTRALPARAERIAPRVEFQLAHVANTLSVLPVLVYGEPPCARVERGALVHLGGPVPARDTAAEVALGHKLRESLDLVLGRRAEFLGADASRFAKRLREWDAATADAARGQFAARTLAPRFAARDDGFDLSFEVASDSPSDTPSDSSPDPGTPRPAAGARASAAAVLHAYAEGLDLVPLEGGGWAPLPAEWLARHGHRVADLLAARAQDGTVPPAARPALLALCDALERPPPPALARLAPLLDDFAGIPHGHPPAGLTAALRPYQQRGVDWLCFLREAEMGAVLADDMGLGKTLQTICALDGRALVVCPRSVVHNWADELRRFRPGLSVAVYHGQGRALDPRADVTLTTYAVLRLDADALARERWDAVVLDEAQAIKNPDSQTARAAYALRARFRVALSGTPVENRLEELWSLFHFTNPGLLGGRGDFAERYEQPISSGDSDALERLRARAKPFLLRRLKRDVAQDLPPRTDTVLHCELDEQERAVYDAVRAAAQKDVVTALRQGEGGTLAALEALLRLRQAACHAGLVPGQYVARSSKLERLLEALSEAVEDGHRALVFSQWTSLLDRAEPLLRDAGIAFARLDGATRDRAAVVREFQHDAGPPVLLASLKAGGTGLNLTAADHVFLLDPWWNPATEDQAADRAHRLGQTRPVLVHRLVALDTVEERILALQSRKRALADAALAGGDPAAALTRDDLLELLE